MNKPNPESYEHKYSIQQLLDEIEHLKQFKIEMISIPESLGHHIIFGDDEDYKGSAQELKQVILDCVKSNDAYNEAGLVIRCLRKINPKDSKN